jgi:hypothetical protein
VIYIRLLFNWGITSRRISAFLIELYGRLAFL